MYAKTKDNGFIRAKFLDQTETSRARYLGLSLIITKRTNKGMREAYPENLKTFELPDKQCFQF